MKMYMIKSWAWEVEEIEVFKITPSRAWVSDVRGRQKMISNKDLYKTPEEAKQARINYEQSKLDNALSRVASCKEELEKAKAIKLQ